MFFIGRKFCDVWIGCCLNTILSFILTCLIIESTPGPNMAYLAILSAGEGRKAGFSAVAGIALGLLIIGLAAALGVATIISNLPAAYHTLRWCGVFYMLWLAWDGWNTGREMSPDKANGNEHRARFFWRGFVTNVLNPKAAIFYVAILPSFVNASLNVSKQTLVLTVIYVCVATFMHSCIVALAGMARIFLDSPRRILIARRVLSLLLATVAVWFAVSTSKAFG